MKRLKWGETPWDKLSRDELLREVQRMYAAITAARSVLHILRHHDQDSVFWKAGSGGSSIEECDQVTERVETEFDGEDVYRSFFRFATDLLFEDRGKNMRANWHVCQCGIMTGHTGPGVPVCAGCEAAGCKVPMRPITWDDLKPK
jgi:hypothetical protein